MLTFFLLQIMLCAIMGVMLVRSEILMEWKFIDSSGVGETLERTNGSYTITNLGSPSYPGGRFDSGFCSSKDGVYLYGGFTLTTGFATENFMGLMWYFDHSTQNWTWLSTYEEAELLHNFSPEYTESNKYPGSRVAGKMEYNELTNSIFMFGGQVWNSSVRNDLWIFNISTQSHNTTVSSWNFIDFLNNGGDSYNLVPPKYDGLPGEVYPGSRCRSLVLSHEDAIYVWGGANCATESTTIPSCIDFWLFNITTSNWTWIAVTEEERNLSITSESHIDKLGKPYFPGDTSSGNPFGWIYGNGLFMYHTKIYDSSYLWRYDLVTLEWNIKRVNDAKHPSFSPGRYNVGYRDHGQQTFIEELSISVLFGGYSISKDDVAGVRSDLWLMIPHETDVSKTYYVPVDCRNDTYRTFFEEDVNFPGDGDRFPSGRGGGFMGHVGSSTVYVGSGFFWAGALHLNDLWSWNLTDSGIGCFDFHYLPFHYEPFNKDPRRCNDHGACQYGEELEEPCACDDDYFGKFCQFTTCFGVKSNDSTKNVCSGHGFCYPHQECTCDDSFVGEDCSKRIIQSKTIENQTTKLEEDFELEISIDTFFSSDEAISLSVLGLPDWLEESDIPPRYIGRFRSSDLDISETFYSLDINYPYLYVATDDSEELAIFDISNYSDPIFISNISMGSNTSDVVVYDNVAFVVVSGGIESIDICDPSNPFKIGHTDITVDDFGIGVDGFGYLYVVADEMTVFDIIDSSLDPNTIVSSTHSIKVSDEFAYIGYDGSFYVKNVTNRANPILTDSDSSCDGVVKVVVRDDYAFLAENQNGWKIMSIEDKSDIKVISSLINNGEYVRALSFGGIRDNYLFVGTSSNGFYVYDIHHSKNLTGIAVAEDLLLWNVPNLSGRIWDIVVERNRVFLGCSEGLDIYDFGSIKLSGTPSLGQCCDSREVTVTATTKSGYSINTTFTITVNKGGNVYDDECTLLVCDSILSNESTKVCNGHGNCTYSSNPDGLCVCEKGWDPATFCGNCTSDYVGENCSTNIIQVKPIDDQSIYFGEYVVMDIDIGTFYSPNDIISLSVVEPDWIVSKPIASPRIGTLDTSAKVYGYVYKLVFKYPFVYSATCDNPLIAVFNVSDYSNPTWVTDIDLGTGNLVRDVVIDDNSDVLYAGTVSGVFAYNISDAPDFVYLGVSDQDHLGAAYEMSKDGDFVYIMDETGTNGMNIYDVSDPTNIRFVSDAFTTLGGARGIKVRDSIAYLAS